MAKTPGEGDAHVTAHLPIQTWVFISTKCADKIISDLGMTACGGGGNNRASVTFYCVWPNVMDQYLRHEIIDGIGGWYARIE